MDPIRVPRIENWVPRIRENNHRVPGIKENRVPRIREIRSLQVIIGYLTFSLKNLICVLFLAHIPFVVIRTFNATPTERLQPLWALSCL